MRRVETRGGRAWYLRAGIGAFNVAREERRKPPPVRAKRGSAEPVDEEVIADDVHEHSRRTAFITTSFAYPGKRSSGRRSAQSVMIPPHENRDSLCAKLRRLEGAAFRKSGSLRE